MTDNELIAVLATQLEAASAKAGWNYVVLQKDQPTQQGVPTDPAIFFEKLFDVPYGFPMVGYVYNPPAPPAVQGTYTTTEKQWVETTFQVSAMAIQDPTNLTIPTASDIVNYMKMYVNSRACLAILKASQAGVLRITNVRNPYAKDDRDIFEASPSFDMVIQHQRTIAFDVPATDIVEGALIEGVQGQGVFPV